MNLMKNVLIIVGICELYSVRHLQHMLLGVQTHLR